MDEKNVVLQKLVPKLITSLTGFKPNDENFKICMEFSYSHFKYHKFLSVNSHEVKRDIDGICQKFKLNHFPDEEKILRRLFEQSLSHEIFINHEQKEIMYAVMNMIISLAYDPITKIKERKRRGLPIVIKSHKSDHEECQNSRKQFIDTLLQDNFKLPKHDTDSDLSEWSEWTESEDEEMNRSTDPSETESKSQTIPLIPNIRPPRKMEVYKKVKLDNALKWLKENTQSRWWNEKEMTYSDVQSSDKSANFYTEWQQHLTRKSLGFIKPPPVSLLSEYCLLREILWMFVNPVDCKFFCIKENEITARNNVSLPSTTIDSLQIFLKYFLRPMNIMYWLKKDIQKALRSKSLNHTLENYYGLLEKFLDEITEFLITQEEVLKAQEETFTIVIFQDKIKSHSKILEMLWYIHTTCVLDEKYPSHIRSLYLIANLNYHVNHSECKEKKNLSLTFLLTCLKTYLQILDVWWTEARLHDSKNEFVVEKIFVEDVEFIQQRLIAKCKEKAFYINDKISQKITEDNLITTLLYYSSEATFTLEVISKLDRIHEMKQFGDNTSSLYDQFMKSITSEILELASNKDLFETQDKASDLESVDNNIKIAADIRNEMIADNNDLMLMIFNSTLEQLESMELACDKPKQSSPLELYKNLNRATNSILLPLENSIGQLLKKLLAAKIAIAEKFVMDIYFHEFHMEQYLREVRKVFFLESNELINLFNMQLFPQMERGEKWANSYLLTVLFNETVTTSWDTTLFTVHVNKILGHQTILEAIDELSIYLNVTNNFDNIFTSSSVAKYNEVFRFLLKIKYAQRILNCLLFPDFYKNRLPFAKFTMLDLVIKRLALTRFSMQQAITMIHNHLMVNLQSLSMEFEENMSKTQKITDVIVQHEFFVQNFHSKSLLSGKSKKIRGIVIELVKLAKVVVNEWNNIITFYELDSAGKTVDDSISLTTLNVNTIEIENAFKTCEKQLKDLFYY